MLQTLILVIQLQFFSIHALATQQACKEIDLRQDEMIGTTNPNQGSTLWCASFAAADLISAELRERVSVLDLALKNAMLVGFKYEAGHPRTSLPQRSDIGSIPQIASMIGVCLEPEINWPTKLNRDIKPLIDGLDTTHRRILNSRKSPMLNRDGLCRQPALPAFDQTLFANLSDIEQLQLALMAPEGELLDKLNKKTCGQSKYVNISEATVDGDGDRILEAVEDQLERRKPIQISINSNFFTTGIAEKATSVNGITSTHASLVLGRKWIEGQCRYIVKNFWGSECSHKYKLPCENGFLFITPSELKSTVGNANWIVEIRP